MGGRKTNLSMRYNDNQDQDHWCDNDYEDIDDDRCKNVDHAC